MICLMQIPYLRITVMKWIPFFIETIDQQSPNLQICRKIIEQLKDCNVPMRRASSLDEILETLEEMKSNGFGPDIFVVNIHGVESSLAQLKPILRLAPK